jgi:hypothetical protein
MYLHRAIIAPQRQRVNSKYAVKLLTIIPESVANAL